MTVAREKSEIQASGRRRVRFSISAASMQQPNWLIIGHFKATRQSSGNGQHALSYSRKVIPMLPCHNQSPLRAMVFWRVALYSPENRTGRQLHWVWYALPETKSGKTLPPLSGETLIAS